MTPILPGEKLSGNKNDLVERLKERLQKEYAEVSKVKKEEDTMEV